MSSGGVAQLVAIGAQDAFLVGNPQVSFFQSMYKHHTNFSQVVDRQVIQGNPTSGGMTTVKFERKGDMIGYVYLVGNNGSNTYATYDWSNVVNYAELYIGGQLIDTQDSKFTEYLAVDLFAQNLSKSALGSFHGGAGTLSYFYPFRFFFCENWQSALPLVGLQYHDVEIRIYWNQPNSDPTYGVIKNWDCYTQYIFLDDSEREMFSKKTQYMLMTQVQKSIPVGSLKMQEIVFNHPMKYLVSSSSANQNSSNALTSSSNMVLVQINGTDIGDYKYACPNFTSAMGYYHAPFSYGNDNDFFFFPFCLDSSKMQPTGSLNFSRLDSVRIISQSVVLTDPVYGVNYNILKIEKGMGALMYSN